ncbi:restriction endonuclease subunit S (plasmid) [Oenococcus alcoholitolerans]|uniref:restriction endonuclease subunit S n=1 Tax=Oenococcus alcoholitolerans TaxID=931074 RepID=UPI003F70A3FA
MAPFNGYTSTEIFPIQTLNGLLPTYLRYCLLSPYFVNTINQSMYGIKMPRVGTQFLASQIFPLPPLDEQKRIVVKIYYLFQKL